MKKPKKHKCGETVTAARMGISQQVETVSIEILQSCVTPGQWRKAYLDASSQSQVLFGVFKVSSILLNSHLYGVVVSTPFAPILGCITPSSTINLLTTLNKLKWISLGCLAICKHHNSPNHKHYMHSIKLSLGKVQNRRPSEIIGCQLPSGICQS